MHSRFQARLQRHRRPCESRGPYAAASRFEAVGVDTLHNNQGRWLWVPAFAGTTASLFAVSRRLLCSLATAQEAAEQAWSALARDQRDVADQFGAALAPLQHDLAAVKRLQFDAVGDADDGGFGQLPDDDLHHLVLALFVERGGRLIQYHDVGVVQQEPGESQPLL